MGRANVKAARVGEARAQGGLTRLGRAVDGDNHGSVVLGHEVRPILPAALTGATVVRWQGPEVAPPLPTDAEAAYLQAISPLRARVGTLQRRLNTARQQVERGQAASQDAAALRSLVDDLRSTRDAYVAARGAGRLFKYHGMMVVSLNEGMGAAELLAQASQIESSDVRARLVASASKHGQESERLQAAAAEAYGKTLPVVVQ